MVFILPVWGRESKAPMNVSSIVGNSNKAETVRRQKSLGF